MRSPRPSRREKQPADQKQPGIKFIESGAITTVQIWAPTEAECAKLAKDYAGSRRSAKMGPVHPAAGVWVAAGDVATNEK